LDREDVCWTAERECVIQTELDWAFPSKNRLSTTGFLWVNPNGTGFQIILKDSGTSGDTQHLNQPRYGEMIVSRTSLCHVIKYTTCCNLTESMKHTASSRIRLLFRDAPSFSPCLSQWVFSIFRHAALTDLGQVSCWANSGQLSATRIYTHSSCFIVSICNAGEFSRPPNISRCYDFLRVRLNLAHFWLVFSSKSLL
jgi:hypothetical protein